MNPRHLPISILVFSGLLAWCLFESVRAPQTVAAQGLAIRVGGGYDSLAPEQQALVREWHEEFAKITGNRIDPKAGYDNLRLSLRTTFDAVTHALLQTKLTDSRGKSLGNALSLVKLSEAVHGEVPNTNGGLDAPTGSA